MKIKFLSENLILDLIFLFNIIPILYIFNIPSASILPLIILIPFLFTKLNLYSNFSKVDKFTFFIFLFFIYHFFNLLISYFSYQPYIVDQNQLFYGTIFATTIKSALPIIVIFLINKIKFRDILRSRYLIILSYTIFAIAAISAIFYISVRYGFNFNLQEIRDILYLQSKNQNIIFSRNSFPSLYNYYGKSNTLAPTFTLVFLSILPYIRKFLSGNYSKINFVMSILGFLLLPIIIMFYSRASILAIFSGFFLFEILNLLKFRQRFLSYTFKIFLLGFSIFSSIILFFGETRYSLDAFFRGGRSEILAGVLNNINTFKFFGNGIGSNDYLCIDSYQNYVLKYKTIYCTLHNYYLTLLHDFGIIGFAIFLVIIYIFLSKLLTAINIFIKNENIIYLKTSNYPFEIITSFYFFIGSLVLLFFDSDIMTNHTIFSILYWFLLGFNFISLKNYVKNNS